jgi:hypothetical protein
MNEFLVSMQIVLVVLEILNVIHTQKRRDELAENTRITKSIKRDLDDNRGSTK